MTKWVCLHHVVSAHSHWRSLWDVALTGTPLLFFIPFHFGHRAGSFVRDYDRWARTELHSHNPTLPITQSSVASVSQADDGPDETGSKQTKSWKRAKPFPEHRDGTYLCAGGRLRWKWWGSGKVNVDETWWIGLLDCPNITYNIWSEKTL